MTSQRLMLTVPSSDTRRLFSSRLFPVIPEGPSLAKMGIVCFRVRSMIPAVVKKLLRYRALVSASYS